MRPLYWVGAVVAVVALIAIGLVLRGNDESSTAKDELKITHAHGLAVHIGDPEALLIATHHGLLLLNDGTLSEVGESRDDLMGFVVDPKVAGKYYSSGHPVGGGNLGFQVSEDAGASWQSVSAGAGGPVDFHALAVSTVNPQIVYGYYGALQRSEDGGKNWDIVNAQIAPIALSTDPLKEDMVYAATRDGVQVSADRGKSFAPLSQELSGGFVSFYATHPTDPKVAFVFSQKLGGLGKSTDGGLTWKKISETFGNEVVLHIAFAPGKPEVAYALNEKNALYRSSDTGETWQLLR